VDVANCMGLLPLMVIAATAVAVLLLVAVRRRHRAAAIMTVIGLSGAVMTTPLAAKVVPGGQHSECIRAHRPGDDGHRYWL
jgi:NADH-quinone oxidoreductase subunit N